MNGFLSQSFPVERSVCQGCSISPVLYVLYVEPYAVKVRKEELINGLKLPGTVEEFRIVQYADDTTLYITDIKSGYNVFKITKDFGKASGSKLNLDKSSGLVGVP